MESAASRLLTSVVQRIKKARGSTLNLMTTWENILHL